MDTKEGLPKIGVGDMVSISHHFNNEFFVFNGDIRKDLEIIKNSVPKDTVILCPYIGHIFRHPAEKL